MKTKLCILVLLMGLSVFVLNVCYHSHTSEAAKVTKKKESRPGMAPLADLAVLPSLNG